MDTIRLGPFILPLQTVLVLAAVLAATGLADWLRKRRGVDAGPVLWKMILAGFVTARAVFVLRHHDIYAASPLGALDIRDGGFQATAGLLAACVTGAELTRRDSALRRPLLVSSLAGAAIWLGGTLASQIMAPAQPPMPDVQVRRLDGSEVPLHSFGGRPLVVNLWATWCPPCRREMPVLIEAQRSYPDVGFVYVNQGESLDTVKRFMAEQGLDTKGVVADPTGRLASRTNSPGDPTTLFYDASGTLRLRHSGELSEATLRDKLDSLREAR